LPKEIPLTNSNIVSIVSDEDFPVLSRWKWRLDERGYVIRKEHVSRDPVTKVKKTRIVQMHRQVMNFPVGLLVDHCNGVKTDNTKNNLRTVTETQNQQNRGMQKNNTTGFKGVTLHKKAGKYIAHIGINGKTKYLGLFDCPIKASEAYEAAAILYHECRPEKNLS